MPLRILVAVKAVPRAATPARFDATTRRLDRSGPSELNQPDEHAIEEALLLRDREGGEIVAVSIMPEAAVETLRIPLAMGADRAIAVSGESLAGSDLLATSRILARVAERERPDLIIFGSQSLDGGGAMLWGAVAERLGMPVLSGARQLSLVGQRIRAVAQRAEGSLLVEAPTPCVVALSGAVNSPRYALFKDIVAAKRKQIEVLAPGDLDLAPDETGAAGSGTRVVSLAPAPPRAKVGKSITDDGQGAAWLYAYLREHVTL